MGDLVIGNFGKKRDLISDVSSEEDDLKGVEIVGKIISLFSKSANPSGGHYLAALRKLELLTSLLVQPEPVEMIKKINSLECSAEALKSMTEIVNKYSDDQVINLLNNSNEGDWRSKPALYRALIRTFLLRCMSIDI